MSRYLLLLTNQPQFFVLVIQRKSLTVARTHLPPLEEYVGYLREIWEEGQVTNNGPLARQLEHRLGQYLTVPYLQFVSNGTVALQLALNALELRGEVITTPYSYVATSNAVHWEQCRPVFADIDPRSLCIDPQRIEEKITEHTTAILATHVYGYPCDVHAIARLAERYHLKVIYDGAHAFGVKVNGTSIYEYGDVSTISFHATKVYHTIEGGAVITHDATLNERVFLSKAFGHRADEHYRVGINGKNSELHAAMGLCNLPIIDDMIRYRRYLSEGYVAQLAGLPVRTFQPDASLTYNYAYFPIVLEDFETMQRVRQALEKEQIFPRRYFYPALNTLPYHSGGPHSGGPHPGGPHQRDSCPVAEDVAQRVLCLPLYDTLEEEDVDLISSVLRKTLS